MSALLARLRPCRSCNQQGDFQTAAGFWMCRQCVSRLVEYLDWLAQKGVEL